MTAVSPRRPGKPPVEPNPGPPPPVPQPRRPTAPRIADDAWWAAYERLCRESFDGTPLAGSVWLPSW